MSTSVSASQRPSWLLPRPSSWCPEGTTAPILTDTTIGDTTLGATTDTRIATGATIIMTGPVGKVAGHPGTEYPLPRNFPVR